MMRFTSSLIVEPLLSCVKQPDAQCAGRLRPKWVHVCTAYSGDTMEGFIDDIVATWMMR